MTTFNAKILEEIAVLKQELTAINSNTGGSGSGTITNAQAVVQYYNGIQTVNLPQSIQLSLVVFRGNGTLVLPGGNIPMPRNFGLDYPFVSFTYLYPEIEFSLNTGNTEIYVQYQLAPS